MRLWSLSFAPLAFDDSLVIPVQLAAASTSVMGASPRGGSPGSLSPRPMSPRTLSPREPAPQAAVWPRLPGLSVDAGTGAAASAAKEGELAVLPHEVSLDPLRAVAEPLSGGAVEGRSPASIAAAVPTGQAAAGEQRSGSASVTAAPASAATSESGALSPSPLAEPSAGVGDTQGEGATFSAFAAAQAQRGGAVAVSLSDTMFASTASTGGRALDAAARASAQSETSSATSAVGSTGLCNAAESSAGGGTDAEQATAPAEGRGMPLRESMLSATDLVEHGQRAAAVEAQAAQMAPRQGETAQPPMPAAVQASPDEAPVAASVPAGPPQGATEAGGGLQPAERPRPPEDVSGIGTAPEGAHTDVEPSFRSLAADAEQPGVSSTPAPARAPQPRMPSGPAADSAPLAAETQASALQGTGATQTAATDAIVVPASDTALEPDAPVAALAPAAGETQQTNAEPVVLATARPLEAGPASALTAAPSSAADGQSGPESVSAARADPDMREAPARSQPVPTAQPAPADWSGAELQDAGPAQEAGDVAVLPGADASPRAAAEAAGGVQADPAAANAVSDEGDDMLDAQSQHSEGSTVSI